MTHVSLENEQINIQHQLALRFAILLGSLSRKHENGKTGFDIEFESLCSIDKNTRLNSGEFVTARLPQNHQKNRYTDVLASMVVCFSLRYHTRSACGSVNAFVCMHTVSVPI